MSQLTTIERQAPVALLAIAQHTVDHGLPAPLTIDFPFDGRPLSILVLADTLPAWLSSLVVDDEAAGVREYADGKKFAWQTANVRLPDTGVAFQVRSTHLMTELSAVAS